MTTGLRQGELLALKWSDLDLSYGNMQQLNDALSDVSQNGGEKDCRDISQSSER
jgi:hypothetical protein